MCVCGRRVCVFVGGGYVHGGEGVCVGRGRVCVYGCAADSCYLLMVDSTTTPLC